VDGSFKAGNTSSCRKNLKLFTGSFTNATISNDTNSTVWFYSRVLKYMHPSAFHCYFAGKETYMSFEKYIKETSKKDIWYNIIYKTGKMCDQIRVIYRLMKKPSL
jgi:hypothetical protein